MNKSILYRLFNIGGIPRKLRSVLEVEGIEVCDEGMSGWLVTKNVKGPGRWHIYRREGFSGSLVVTSKRIICFTYWNRQINIAVDDPKITELFVSNPSENMFSISFESGVFRDGWSGVIEFLFKTEKARQFHTAFKSAGATQGTAAAGNSSGLH